MRKNANKLTESELKILILDYTDNLLSNSELMIKYNISYSYLYKTLNQYNVFQKTTCFQNNRKYFVKQDFFENIDTEEKAYFLGFLYADGNVYVSDNGVKSNISLGLIESDKEILDKLNLLIDNKRKLVYIKPKLKRIKNKSFISKGQYRLDINSLKMSKDLINQGCFPKKSLTLKFPTEEQVPKELIFHFIRGYFDGDGWLGIENGSICGTESFVISLKNILSNYNIKSFIRKRTNIYELIINGIQFRNFLKLIYLKSTIYLNRKFNLFKIHLAYEKSLRNRYTKNYTERLSFFAEMQNEKLI